MLHRFKNKTYTDSDILALYMNYREENIGPFIREVGDFIAHKDRDRGNTCQRTVYMYSQLGFFIKYLGTNRVTLLHFGECPWWLETWFFGKIEREPMSVLKRVSGLKKTELIKEVKSWFEGKRSYSTKLVCVNPELFYKLKRHLSRTITGEYVFSIDKVRNEILQMLSLEGIDPKEITPVLIATAVLLNDRSVEITNGITATLSLIAGPTMKSCPTNKDKRIIQGATNLKIHVTTTKNMNDGFHGIGLDFLDTEIDASPYFESGLVEIDKSGRPSFGISKKITFERSAHPMVFEG